MDVTGARLTRTTWPEAAEEAGRAVAAVAGILGDCLPGLLVSALRPSFPDGEPRPAQTSTLHVPDRVIQRLLRLVEAELVNDEAVLERYRDAIADVERGVPAAAPPTGLSDVPVPLHLWGVMWPRT